ncbi:MAG: protein translocase subunit SecD [Planctomycetaceae bacterium]|nr:protein translocase subunit SecD [Planctomycetaceae bacterium]
MFALSQLPTLLAADNRIIKLNLPSFGTESLQIPGLFFVVLALIVASFVFGYWFANTIRMKDYGWKVGLILATFTSSLAICLLGQYKLGVDLQGGVILVYEVDEEETKQLVAKDKAIDLNMGRLVQVLRDRLNETGLKEIVVRPFGPRQIEIVVPEVDEDEVRKLEEKITTGGTLQFMIVATEIKDAQLFEIAKDRAATLPPDERNRRPVVNDNGEQIGYWARMGRERSATSPETAPFRDPSVLENGLIRDARTGEIIDLPISERFRYSRDHVALQRFLTQRGTKDIDALMVYDVDYNIRGETDLAGASPGLDQQLRPCIFFTMRGEGEFKMGNLTARNLQRKLAIIFDNELKSAPVINDKITKNGEITGQFSQEEVNFIVDILKSGSLPVVLHKNPISKNTIGSILGLDTIIKGSWSITGALAAVFVFLIVYYRFAGIVAGLALTLNIMLTVAFMVLFQAPFTLPGLAGLVLTVGMSVDANVLIFERMREEQARGAALRMTIRNGFDRALSAIIDGNLTTLFTALVLYAIGTDQVRGFGATLIIGNITSMFTAIFCARVVFDIVERQRWLSRISMSQLLPTPSIDWCKLLMPAMGFSILVIAIGLAATVARGKGIFDIDLAGGTSVTVILKQPASGDQEVRDKVAAVLDKLIDPNTKGKVDHTVHEVSVRGEPQFSVYKIDSSLPEVTDLQQRLREAFREGDQDGLRTFQVELAQITEKKIEPPPAAAAKTEDKPATIGPPSSPFSTTPPATRQPPPPVAPKAAGPDPAPTTPAAPAAPTEPKPGEKKEGEAEKPDSSGCQDEPAAEAKKDEAKPAATAKSEDKVKTEDKPAQTTPASPPSADAPATSPAAADPGAPATVGPPATTPPPPAPPAPEFESTVVLKFPKSAITEKALRERLRTSASAALNRALANVAIDNPNWNRTDNSAFEVWTVKLPLSKAQTQKLVDHLKSQLGEEVVWQTSSKIGGQVSEDTRWRAVGAIGVSLLLILAYVWFRFHQAIWGVAAIVALAHDALVMLGGIAISYWLVGVLGWAQVEEFKISLPVVAAFLTLIGYSVNDTIVIFDRIREIRGKSPDLTPQMINDSVNQTLSRTIITGGLVLMVVVVLYFFGGSGIHAFAFSLVVGVISGSYSTVFIAAPLLLWLLGKRETAPAKVPAREMAKTGV